VAKYDASGMLAWTRQLGTSSREESTAVSADGLGNVYISGYTEGSLAGTNGFWDAFVTKYDASGTLQWTRQLGTSSSDGSYGVSADGLGNVYISGVTEGSLAGTNAGGGDAFVSKYDAGGTLQWTRQLGTVNWESSTSVSTDGLGSVYISGWNAGAANRNAFVAKFTTAVVDFNGDGDVNGDDVDALVAEIVAGTDDLAFDLSGDGAVNNVDLSQWLSDAATENGFAAPYLRGDANLDGNVNASDLNSLGQNWQGSPNAWQSGNFTADGIVDANDLYQLAQNWLATIPSAAALQSVPEPSGWCLLVFSLAGIVCRRR
jgi:hypothetical protein